MSRIRAIETRYRGHLFRSRLEARYAMLLDFIGVVWAYEDTAYLLPDGTIYVPDFSIYEPEEGTDGGPSMFLEVKGQYPTDREIYKMQMVCDALQCHGSIVAGLPSFARSGMYGLPEVRAACYNLASLRDAMAHDPTPQLQQRLDSATGIGDSVLTSSNILGSSCLSVYEFGVTAPATFVQDPLDPCDVEEAVWIARTARFDDLHDKWTGEPVFGFGAYRWRQGFGD